MNKLKIAFICLIFALSGCVNLANKQARAYYPKFEHLSDPEHNFEQFWNHYKDRYAFFEPKGIDWDATYRQYRPMVTPETSEEELIKIFAEMVNPLKDGHICICRNGESLISVDGGSQKSRTIFPYRKTNPQDLKSKRDTFWDNVEVVLGKMGFNALKRAVKSDANYYAFNYAKAGDIGYLHISNFEDHRNDLDNVLKNLSDTEGLIIDIRFNPGGSVGYEMAGRFCKEKKQTHYKVLKNKAGYDGFSKPKPYYVVPEGEQYLKPIVILTNDGTGSAAEDFALSLSLEKQVTIVGTNTRGSFSDIYSYRLPNGISAWLSYQQYYSMDNVLLEGKGVQPTIWVENSWEDIENERDPVLEKALEIITGK